MKFAALFRNLNLAQRGAPSRAQLEVAFFEAGALAVASFQTNGTVLFEARSPRHAQKVLRFVQEALAESTGFDEPAFLRTFEHLRRLAERLPFAHIDETSTYGFYVTFLHEEADVDEFTPRSNTRGDVQVVEYTASEALTCSYKIGASPGSPNLFLERALGLPATTRSWNTVQRLIARDA